jgi:hypothetical protein
LTDLLIAIARTIKNPEPCCDKIPEPEKKREMITELRLVTKEELQEYNERLKQG